MTTKLQSIDCEGLDIEKGIRGDTMISLEEGSRIDFMGRLGKGCTETGRLCGEG